MCVCVCVCVYVCVCVLRPCQQPVAAMSISFECVSLPPGQVKKKAVNQYLSRQYRLKSLLTAYFPAFIFLGPMSFSILIEFRKSV